MTLYNPIIGCVNDIVYTRFGLNLSISSQNDPRTRSRNDLDLHYAHNFINLISCLHLPTFMSQAAIVSEKSAVFSFFPIEKPKLPKG